MKCRKFEVKLHPSFIEAISYHKLAAADIGEGATKSFQDRRPPKMVVESHSNGSAQVQIRPVEMRKAEYPSAAAV